MTIRNIIQAILNFQFLSRRLGYFLMPIYWFLLLQNTGCKKDTPTAYHTTIHGVVMETITGNKVSGATVILGKSPVGASGYQTLSFCKSDANGNYSFDFTAEPTTGYEVVGQCYKHFDSPGYAPSVGLSNSINIVLKPYAYIKFHIKNTNPSSSDITFYGSTTFRKELFGANIDTLLVSSPTPPGPQVINWDVLDVNNVKTKFSSQITTVAFDTIPVTINY
jgi:hypothetical protein